MAIPPIPGWLTATSPERLLMQPAPREEVGRDRSDLAQIASAPAVDPRLRVLAAELLADAGQPPQASLAEVYVKTLPDGFAHNLWGMPGEYVERLGERLLGFGKAAVPSLVPLLDDHRRLAYFGSEEPTLNEKMGFRVSDLAAYLICRLTNRPYVTAPDLRSRDVAIGRLKRALSTAG